MSVMDKRYEEALLFDFYGELLTDRQKQIFEEVIMDDYSMSEVADEYGITRQGVHDMIKRCGKILEGYEEKLGLVRRFLEVKKKTEEIRKLAGDERIIRLADEILEDL